ncbi:MAG: glycosyltransferase family 2 protein [Marinoscillum sp.]
MQPKLTILILVYADVQDGIRLYKQLKGELRTDNIQLLVIDNDCTEKELLRSVVPEEEILVNQKNLGYAGGNNAGVKHCLEQGGEYLMILNPDIEISVATIENLLISLDQNVNAAFVGPRICFRNDRNRIYSDGGRVEPARAYRVSHINSDKSTESINPGLIECDYMNGSALIGRIAAIREFGVLRDEYFIYFEETEWCLRAKDFGYQVLVDTNQVAYHMSSPKGGRYQFLMRRNKLWLAKMRGEYVFKTVVDSFWKVIRLSLSGKPYKKAHWLGFVHGVIFSAKDHAKSNPTFFKIR